jgi:competence protein ComEA
MSLAKTERGRPMVQWEWDFTSREKKWMIVSGGLALALIVCLVWIWKQDETPKESAAPLTPYQPAEADASDSPDTAGEKNPWIMIDVKGAVKKPGIYRLDPESRVHDAILKAGGARSDADLDQVNLAGRLTDGKVVYIPKKGETLQGTAWMNPPADGTGGKININSATAEELQQLNGVGAKKAQAIVSYREENGPFQSIEEISNVPGIGEKTLEQFRDQITL